jgi:hypothetical protein
MIVMTPVSSTRHFLLPKATVRISLLLSENGAWDKKEASVKALVLLLRACRR